MRQDFEGIEFRHKVRVICKSWRCTGWGWRHDYYLCKALGITGWYLVLRLTFGLWLYLIADIRLQETLNYWKQLPHILKYFRAEEDPNAKRPENFMSGFLEVSLYCTLSLIYCLADNKPRAGTERSLLLVSKLCTYPNKTQTDSWFSSRYAVQCNAGHLFSSLHWIRDLCFHFVGKPHSLRLELARNHVT